MFRSTQAANQQTVTETDTTASSVAGSGVAVACTDLRTGVVFPFRAQRILWSGAIDTTWSQESSQICLGSLEGLRQALVGDGTGGAYVGWVDHRSGEPDIYLQHVTADGTVATGWPAGGLPVCTLPMSQYHLDLAPDGAGGVFLTWEDYRAGRSGDIYAQRITAAGVVAPGWPAQGLAVCISAGEQSLPHLASAGEDAAWVTWQDRRSGVLRVYLQRLTAAGERAPGWPEDGAPLAAAAPPACAPLVAVDSVGAAVVVWRHERSGGASELMALPITGFDPTGVGGVATPLVLSSGADELGDVAVVRAGGTGLLVSWAEWRAGVGVLRAQRLLLAGGGLEQWASGGIVVHEGKPGRNAPAVLCDSSGASLIAWEDSQGGAGTDIYVQRITGDGAVATGWPETGLPVCLAPGDQYAPHLASDGVGGALATWADATEAAIADFMRARAVLSASPPELRDIVARPGHVQLTWLIHTRGAGPLHAQRRVGEGAWQDLAEVAPDDSLRLIVDDRTVAEGTHAAYRLGLRSRDLAIYFEPVAVDVPVAPTVLLLRAAWARAAEHAIMVAFALPRGPSPVLDLIDVAGRRVANRQLSDLEPGEQKVRFNLPSRLASGVYFVRLVQGSQSRVAKVVYIR